MIKIALNTLDKRGKFFKVVLVLFVILAIAVGAALVKVNSMVGEQLRLTVTPEYLESTAVGTEPELFEVDIKVYTKFICQAICNYTLTDVSHNVLIDRGFFDVNGFRMEHYSKDLPMVYEGYGTNLYLYRLECRSNQSTFCPATKDVIIRKSLLVLSYEPSDEQSSALSFLETNFPHISENFVNASKNVLLSGKIIDSVDFPFDIQGHSSLEDDVSRMGRDIDAVLNSWINDDYLSAMSLVDGDDMIIRSKSLQSDSLGYLNYLYQTIDGHNELLGYANQNYGLLETYVDILSISDDLSGLNSSEMSSILNFVLRSNSAINTLNTERYNRGALYADILELGEKIPGINKIILERSRQGIIDSYAPLFIYSNILCLMDQDEDICSIVDNNKISSTVSSFYESDNVSVVSTGFDELCSIASDIASDIDSELDSYTSISNDTDSGDNDSANNDSMQVSELLADEAIEMLLLEYKFLSDYKSFLIAENITSNPEFRDAGLAYYEFLIKETLSEDYGISNPDAELAIHEFAYENLLLNQDSRLLSKVLSISRYCKSGSDMTLPNLNTITSKSRSIPYFDEPSVKSPNIPVIVKKCCIYNMCQSCDIHNDNNPLVLLHGHSLNQGVDAYRAIEIFDGLEYSLSGENLYFLTGLLVKGGNSTPGILGRYNVPVVSKPTYYLETYNDLFGLNIQESKTDNIDTYALRLKESIDHTLYLTGNDKVDIIAHSMGGLVVRRYMQIFGTDNVGTVILVGTPSNGINTVTYNLCKLFGASAECEDMRSDSLFMSKLNDPSNQPDFSNMYLVIGRGCETEGVDGDGVVTLDSAVINNFPEDHILYIDRGDDGCSVTNVFHQDLIRMNKYPEVYAFIKSKLEVQD